MTTGRINQIIKICFFLFFYLTICYFFISLFLLFFQKQSNLNFLLLSLIFSSSFASLSVVLSKYLDAIMNLFLPASSIFHYFPLIFTCFFLFFSSILIFNSPILFSFFILKSSFREFLLFIPTLPSCCCPPPPPPSCNVVCDSVCTEAPPAPTPELARCGPSQSHSPSCCSCSPNFHPSQQYSIFHFFFFFFFLFLFSFSFSHSHLAKKVVSACHSEMTLACHVCFLQTHVKEHFVKAWPAARCNQQVAEVVWRTNHTIQQSFLFFSFLFFSFLFFSFLFSFFFSFLFFSFLFFSFL